MSHTLGAEQEVIRTFRRWFTENGGQIHPDIRFCADETGFSVKCEVDLPSGTTVVSCPFTLAITLENIQEAVQFHCKTGIETNFSERQLICTYISLHWILDQDDSRLRHHPYLNILPKPEKLLTPLYFSEDELNLFLGTNLYGATRSQRVSWEKEWTDLRTILYHSSPLIAEKYTWDMYLAAATYLSSRAFPSTILSTNPSLVATPSSYQVLIPGVDSLNHARGRAVTWTVSIQQPLKSELAASQASDLCIALTLNTPYAAGSELFNNYGPKPNSSLILGYGFAIEDNPDDTILLKIGSRNGPQGSVTESLPSRSEYEVGREARGADLLWDDVRTLMASSFPDSGREIAEEEDKDITGAAREVQVDIQTADTLSNMVSDLLDRLPLVPVDDSASFDQSEKYSALAVRPEVRKMWICYVQGQIDILTTLLGWIDEKEREAIHNAEGLGIDVDFADEADGSE